MPAVEGLNHVTLAVSDLARSFDFYVEVLGFEPRARWVRGAYVSAGDLWLCLSLDAAVPARDYTHVAFSIAAGDLAYWNTRLDDAEAARWKENSSEGESIYCLDPDGHQIELHVGDLSSRLDAIRHQPYEGLEIFDQSK